MNLYVQYSFYIQLTIYIKKIKMIEIFQSQDDNKGPLWEYCQNEKRFMVIPFEKDLIHIHLLRQFITIINHQLPNMSQKDLCETIFSPNNQNCLLCDQHHIIGGICFKKIDYQKAMQIIFFVVAQKHQRKGNGSLLMNHFKNYLVKRSIKVVGTYSDNNAIGFYEKHAFAETQIINNKVFQGNITYLNSTLMQTAIRSNIDYFCLSKCLKNQKQFMQNLLNEQTIKQNQNKSHYLWSLDKSYLQTQRYVSINEKIRIQKPSKVLQKQFKQKISFFPSKRILNHTLNTYLTRLQAMLIPELIELDPYFQQLQIFQYRMPISLENIKEKVKAELYLNVRQFKSDLQRMVENCLQFYQKRANIVLNLYELKDLIANFH